MGQVIFVVWRESIEALLVIGILWTWVNRNDNTQNAKRWLLSGIVAGLVLACVLALALVGISIFTSGEVQQWFEIGMLTLASILIVQMVLWMRKHGRTLKRELEEGLQKNVESKNWWGIFFLAMIAVGREGSETVLFLYGSFLAIQNTTGYVEFFGAVGIGLALALLFFYLLQIGSKFISWRIFFRVTEIMLLFLGCSLFLTAMEKMLTGPLGAYNLPNWLYATMWNSDWLLNDSSTVGTFVSSLFAYRSAPIGFDLVVYAVYWGLVFFFLWTPKRTAQTQTA